MPQMSPMNWMCLFLFFNLVFYMTVCKLNYFSSSTTHNVSNGNRVNDQIFITKI